MSLVEQITQYLQYPQSLERLGICTTCPELQKESLNCNQCGCNMKIKVLMPGSNCPLKKW
jgi:hypothetical protein